MRVLIISDDLPGHVNQANGLYHFIDSQIEKCEVSMQVVKLHRKWMRRILSWALNSRLSTTSILIKFAYKLKKLENIEEYDLLISAGGNTSFFNAYLGAEKVIKNVFIGSLRHLSPDLFTVVMTLESVGSDNNIVMPFSPSLTTYKSTREAAQRYQQQHGQIKNKLWLMVIGGNGAGCQYSEQDWINLAKGMEVLAERYQIKWLVTTSRRTGLENEVLLKQYIPEHILQEAVWYNHNPKKVMQSYFGLSENIFCTIDSMSMITEGISSCIKTSTIKPLIASLDNRYQDALNRFEDTGLLKQLVLENFHAYDYLVEGGNIKELVDNQYLKLKTMLKKMLF